MDHFIEGIIQVTGNRAAIAPAYNLKNRIPETLPTTELLAFVCVKNKSLRGGTAWQPRTVINIFTYGACEMCAVSTMQSLPLLLTPPTVVWFRG